LSDQQTPQLLQIRKYPNRRYYDTTRSRHVTLRNLYELVRDGHTVKVADSRTGEDITNAILLQVLLNRAPSKLELLPSAFLHQMLRAERQDLRLLVEEQFRARRRQGNPVARSDGTELDPTEASLPGSVCTISGPGEPGNSARTGGLEGRSPALCPPPRQHPRSA